ncbi:NDR1/HIN1-like protein 13 [Silene latifolia]|uniref:NDR1/HIN1-like protein 13 n=1 Tax=Silene latifolia TaxID=37657 RepID=UPI003D782E2A
MNTSEKVHPTTKKPPTIPTTKPATAATTKTTTTIATATPPLKPPPYKNQQFAPVPRYRPRPLPTHRDDLDRHPRRRRRQCCTCKCFFLTILWVILITIAFLLLAAVTAAVFYFVYNPKPPSFTLSSFKIAQFNLTSPTQFNANTKFNLSLTTTNPNGKIKFYYSPIKLTLITHQNIVIGQGKFPSFIHDVKNNTMLFTTITNNVTIDDALFGKLQNDMKKKNGRVMNLLVKIDAKLAVKIGDKVNVKNVGLKVNCGVIKIHGSKNNGKFSVEIVNENCNVHFFIILNDWEIPI